MLTQERHLQILAQLEEKGTVSVAQLTQLLGASESTVRRDLIALDRLGKRPKGEGGAPFSPRGGCGRNVRGKNASRSGAFQQHI